jgi:hypothetical protein
MGWGSQRGFIPTGLPKAGPELAMTGYARPARRSAIRFFSAAAESA